MACLSAVSINTRQRCLILRNPLSITSPANIRTNIHPTVSKSGEQWSETTVPCLSIHKDLLFFGSVDSIANFQLSRTVGIPKDYHLEPIKCLSDGLKTRLVFCEISLQNPHLLLFDEPTNAADMEMIDSMVIYIFMLLFINCMVNATIYMPCVPCMTFR